MLSRSLLLLVVLALPARAATFFLSGTSVVGTAVPDNDDIGLVDIQTIAAPPNAQIIDISVELGISGGWNGDLYVHLVHDSGFSVLLNRPGRTSGNGDGFSSSGMSLTLSDSAAEDVHTGLPATGSNVTGSFQPDGRQTDPLSVLDTDPRTALLSSFNGIDANGDWTLFIADQAPGATSTLQSWTINLTVIPEPHSLLLIGVGMLGILLRRSRG